MMVNLSIIISILALFFLLGKAADLVIVNIRIIAEKLGIKVFFLGLILGAFTSLPELAVGINAAIDGLPTVSIGNLTGGVFLLFSLVLGAGIILNRNIEATERLSSLLLIFSYFLIPLFLGLTGMLYPWQGLFLIGLYFALVYYLYHRQRHHIITSDGVALRNEKALKNIFLLMVGVALVILFSNLIIKFTETLLSQMQVRPFVIGLILFSVGTNLPEIVVMLKAWRRKVKDLSLSNLIGSGLANTCIFGFLILFKPVSIGIDFSYWILLIFSAFLFAIIMIFYKTGRNLSRTEGIALVGIYFIFIFIELLYLFFKPYFFGL